MGYLPYVIAYGALAVFLIACVARMLKWSRMPMHLRWELYPVAHEGGGRAAYGGSYLEETDWWTKPREVSMLGELKVMVPEILFLVALKEHNKKLWNFSFPFHLGLYLVSVATILMMVAGLMGLVPALAPVVKIIGLVLPFLGVAGLVLGILGALGLLARRMAAPLRDYTAPMDRWNLVFFIVAFGLALALFAVADRDFALVSAFVAGLVTFQLGTVAIGTAGLLLTLSVGALAILAAYIPMTHMSHFIGKYFAYHAIRWRDDPNLRGGKEEAEIKELLEQKVTWAAPHIKGEGKKSWLDVATEEMEK
jgi:nitrate reductase gamma subunit